MEELNNTQKAEQTEILKYGKNDIVKFPEFMDAVITSVELGKAKEVFGEKASDPEQKVITIHYENSEYSFVNAETFNHYPVGKVPEKSKLGKFIIRYDGLEVGKVIKLLQKSNGYFGIVIE